MDRGNLWETLKEKGVSEGLRERLREIYGEAVSKVKAGGRLEENFERLEGVRQRCPLSCKLFALLLADLDEKLEIGGKGGRKKRLFVLAYADDVVLLAKKKGIMRLMMGELKEYLKEKELEVNSRKSKMMRFGKRVGKGKK